ncbi:BTB/POZ domain-containing protein 1-like isoform X2 [Cimex lectularius]|uniref:BTB domain-containing protein n=1 Tax=Cimex lectularius TaxID=79782 RepID=A0A8I6R8W3_CIMLE|nr:BTB/POZ domain-containing protein 1-like isoform X2 [Cimex lectularius]
MSFPIHPSAICTSDDSIRQNYCWRKNNISWGSKLSFLFHTGLLADIKITVFDNRSTKSFEAHQLLLIISSEVFEEMLLKRDENGFIRPILELKIPETNPVIFGLFLKFLYCKSLETENMPKVLEVIRLAKRFLIYDCEEYCIEFIKKEVNHTNCFDIYYFAQSYDLEVLLNMCTKKIQTEVKDILSEKNFGMLGVNNILTILEQRVLDVRETDLFLLVKKWLEFKEVKEGKEWRRNAQKDVLKNFCFLNMTPHEFIDGPGSAGFLTEREFNGILSAIARDRLFPFPEGFKTTCREVIGELNLMTACFKGKTPFEYTIFTVTNCAVFLTVDHDLNITGVQFFCRVGKDGEKYKESVVMRLMDCENNESFYWKIMEEAKFIGFVESSKKFNINFKQPMSLAHGKRYSLTIQMNDPYPYPTVDLLDVSMKSNGVTFYFSQYPKLSSLLPICTIQFQFV